MALTFNVYSNGGMKIHTRTGHEIQGGHDLSYYNCGGEFQTESNIVCQYDCVIVDLLEFIDLKCKH